jgi:hypothetical protein
MTRTTTGTRTPGLTFEESTDANWQQVERNKNDDFVNLCRLVGGEKQCT